EEIVADVVLQLARAVAGEERNVEAGFLQIAAKNADVFLVVPVRAVFVFNLHENDRSPTRGLERREFFADGAEITPARFKIAGVLRADLEVRNFQQPRGQPAEVPFGARIRPGSQDYLKPFALGGAAERGDVGIARKIKFPRR